MKHAYLIYILALTAGAFGQFSFHADAAHTGVSDSPDVREIRGVKWRFKTGAAIVSSPAISNGTIFIGSNDGTFYAVSEQTGELKWKFDTGGPIASSPAIANDVVFFGSYDGKLYALDAATGKERWSFATEYERHFQAKHIHGNEPKEQTIPDAWDFFTSSPVVYKGRVYFGSGDKNIYALNAESGKLVWKFATGDVVHASPAIWQDSLFVGSWDSYLYALDAATGRQKWRFKAGDDPEKFNHVGFQSSPTVVDGTLYVGCRDAHVYAIDAAIGTKKWDFSTGTAWVSNTPAVIDGIVYAGTNPFNALDAKTGSKLFSFNGRSGVFSSPALTTNTVYFGSLIGSLFALDRKSGALLWEFKTDAEKQDPFKMLGPDGKWNQPAFAPMFNDFQDDYVTMYKRFSVGSVVSSPLVYNKEIFFGSTDGTLYALN